MKKEEVMNHKHTYTQRKSQEVCLAFCWEKSWYEDRSSTFNVEFFSIRVFCLFNFKAFLSLFSCELFLLLEISLCIFIGNAEIIAISVVHQHPPPPLSWISVTNVFVYCLYVNEMTLVCTELPASIFSSVFPSHHTQPKGKRNENIIKAKNRNSVQNDIFLFHFWCRLVSLVNLLASRS